MLAAFAHQFRNADTLMEHLGHVRFPLTAANELPAADAGRP